MHTNVLYYGDERPQAELVPLRAGPLSVIFQGGYLRSIRFGEREVIRRMYGAVRDEHWNTVPGVISNLEIANDKNSFEIHFACEHRKNGIHFCWRAEISGAADGTILWKMRGDALAPFLKNRIGLCVTHPARECEGLLCWVEQVDGTSAWERFPQRISPHQVFRKVRQLRHEVVSGVEAEIRFEGEEFETEDQRNWSDASFKTYSTPLNLPFPVIIAPGEPVEQSIRLSIHGSTKSVSAADLCGHPGTVELTVDDKSRSRLPAIGLGTPVSADSLDSQEVERLKTLGLSHLRVELPLSASNWLATFRHAAIEAELLGIPLEVSLSQIQNVNRELQSLHNNLYPVKARICRWLIPTEHFDALREALTLLHPAEMYSGTNENFAELNRNQPAENGWDGLCFSINPQMHCFDNETLVENLAGQASILESVKAFSKGRSIAVSPVTLKPRCLPHAAAEHFPNALPDDVDPRQMSLFGAGWTLASLKYLAEGGASCVSFYETTGWRGVMERQGHSRPSSFPSIPASVFPMYHVFADVGELRDACVLRSHTTNPLLVDSLALLSRGRLRMLIANLTGEQQSVRVRSAAFAGKAELQVLDETNAESACLAPEVFRQLPPSLLQCEKGCFDLPLRPYAIARLDISGVTL